jgi:hypothetical protein
MHPAHLSFEEELPISSVNVYQPVSQYPLDTELDQMKSNQPLNSSSNLPQEKPPKWIFQKLVNLASKL